jgi:hypothetical protein
MYEQWHDKLTLPNIPIKSVLYSEVINVKNPVEPNVHLTIQSEKCIIFSSSGELQ